ncbi:hypothetical protein D9D77_28205, partial [Escherichia coli]|nr:hypothetical protein [Escherichia coli]
SQPGNKQAQATLGMAFIAKAPELSFASSASEQGIGVGVTLTATVTDAGSAKRCPVPNVPVTFTALPDSKAGTNQSSIYHTLSQPSVVTNASGVSQVTLTGQQAWTWITDASVSVNGQTATKEVSVIGTETAETINSQYYFVGAPWPVWFGKNSNISNYTDNADSSLKTWSNTTTWAATPRVNKVWPTSFTFTNQSTKRVLTVTTPRGLTAIQIANINNVKGSGTFSVQQVSGASCNAADTDVNQAQAALNQALARGVPKTGWYDGMYSLASASTYRAQIMVSENGSYEWSGTGVLAKSGTTYTSESVIAAVSTTASQDRTAVSASAAWVGPGKLYAHADNPGPAASAGQLTYGSGTVYSITANALGNTLYNNGNYIKRQWNSISGKVCNDIGSYLNNNRTGGTFWDSSVGTAWFICRSHGGSTSNSTKKAAFVNGLVGGALTSYAAEKWPEQASTQYGAARGWANETKINYLPTGSAPYYAHFIFPVFCSYWQAR